MVWHLSFFKKWHAFFFLRKRHHALFPSQQTSRMAETDPEVMLRLLTYAEKLTRTLKQI